MYNYDAWLTTNREQERADEDWEAYSKQYDTDENRITLINAIFNQMVNDGGFDSMTNNQLLCIKAILTKGFDQTHLDVADIEAFYSYYNIAPSFDKFCEQYRAGDYDDEHSREMYDADERYDQERDNGSD